MQNEAIRLLGDANNAIIRLRGLYSAWSKKHGISYNEMLVLYTIRDYGYCTQRQICDQYLLPWQTMNHVITDMRQRDLLAISPEHCIGREKAFVLSEKGLIYATPLLDSLSRVEIQTIRRIGCENIRSMAQMVTRFNDALSEVMEENA